MTIYNLTNKEQIQQILEDFPESSIELMKSIENPIEKLCAAYCIRNDESEYEGLYGITEEDTYYLAIEPYLSDGRKFKITALVLAENIVVGIQTSPTKLNSDKFVLPGNLIYAFSDSYGGALLDAKYHNNDYYLVLKNI